MGNGESSQSNIPTRTLPLRAAKRAAQPALRTNIDAEAILEKIYEDIEILGRFHRQHGKTAAPKSNPFMAQDAVLKNIARYLQAATYLGLEFFVVNMHSATFEKCLFTDSEVDWAVLINILNFHKHGVRMWAITSGIPYVQNYNTNHHGKIAELGLINPHPLALAPKPPHPHLVYETEDGDTRLCTYTESRSRRKKVTNKSTRNEMNGGDEGHNGIGSDHPHRVITRARARARTLNNQRSRIAPRVNNQSPHTKNMQAREDNLYTNWHMRRRARPLTWPSQWPFPWDPQTANQSEKGPFGPCSSCGMKIVSWPEMQARSRGDMCTCTRGHFLDPPMVQIKQFPSFATDGGLINRGVVARSLIHQNDVIGEYLGVFINVDTFETEPDQTYLFEFLGPMKFNRKNGWWECMDTTSGLIAGYRGNWTRFVNTHRDTSKHNVEFRTTGIGGQLRIVLVALREIRFGEELLATYGPRWFDALAAMRYS